MKTIYIQPQTKELLASPYLMKITDGSSTPSQPGAGAPKVIDKQT